LRPRHFDLGDGLRGVSGGSVGLTCSRSRTMSHLERGRTGANPGLCFVSFLEQKSGDEGGATDSDWCPVLRRFLQTLNDILPEKERQVLLGYADASLVALRNTGVRSHRASQAAEWLMTVHCSGWAQRLGRHDLAEKLASSRFGGGRAGNETIESSLRLLAGAQGKALAALGKPPSAEAAVAARTLMNRSGATAAAAALSPLLEQHFSEQSDLGFALRSGWHSWRLGWDISEALAQADDSSIRRKRLQAVADAMQTQAWQLLERFVGT
jgi:hypothetical protein